MKKMAEQEKFLDNEVLATRLKRPCFLWLGSMNDVIGGLNYVYKGGTVYFWELKGVDSQVGIGKAVIGTRVNGIEGDKEAYPGQKVKYKVTSYNKSEVSQKDRDSVKWL
jgi:hypothetical protein